MSRDQARFKYRCRQCGQVYTGSTSPADGSSEAAPASMLLANAIVGNPGPVSLVCMHDCGDKAGGRKMGVSDLIGFERTNE